MIRPLSVLLLVLLTAHASRAQEERLPQDPYYVATGQPLNGPLIAANDNRTRAGLLEANVHHIRLVVTRGVLYPEDASQPGLWVEAIGESADRLQIPAPLLRARTGESFSVTLFNALPDSSVTWFGLHERPKESPDSLILGPGETRTVTFPAGAPGTYMYRARIGQVNNNLGERDLTAGAFLVDPVGDVPEDRVFVMNIWSQADSLVAFGGYNTLLINGKSYPHTERLVADVGVTERWHVINASGRPHPMHLHGFYYRVLRKGNLQSSTTYTEEDRVEVVTQTLRGRQTMELEWTPTREGEWLFHCHLSFHIEANNRLPGSLHSHDHMSGLVMGISVRPGPSDLIERSEPRLLTLTISQMPDSSRFAFRLDDAADPALTRFTERAPLLELQQYQPTFVTVINNADEPTGIHWHGLELDAWADGVPEVSASDGKMSPSIQPGDSFTYKLTLMRPGTFMYHTHLNDIEQLARGLYGPIVVNPPDSRRDTSVDHTYILGWRRALPRGLENGEVNGIVFTEPQPSMHTRVGAVHRLRVMNIAPDGAITMSMTREGETFPLQFIAKDGADYPEHLQVMMDALPLLWIGETADMRFAPTEPGTYELQVGYRGLPMVRQTWTVE
jgi:FtsP/CotA-like multicopper oxidase with cupredoxin domain